MYLYIYVYMYVFFPILTWSPIAQLVERAAVNRKVDGSSPSGRVVQEKLCWSVTSLCFAIWPHTDRFSSDSLRARRMIMQRHYENVNIQ